ncbi:MAG: hypothetical protein RIR77_2163 [Planctomycetota bacterium]
MARGQVLHDHPRIGGMQAVPCPVEATGIDELVIAGVEHEVRASLVCLADEVDDRPPGPRVVDVPDVEAVTQIRAAGEHALEERAVGAVVALANPVASAVGEAGCEEEEDVHGGLQV